MAYDSYGVPTFPKGVLQLSPPEAAMVLSAMCPGSATWDTTHPMDMNVSGSVWSSWLMGCLAGDRGGVCPPKAFSMGRPRSQGPWSYLPDYATRALGDRLQIPTPDDPRTVMARLYDHQPRTLRNQSNAQRARANASQWYMLW